MISQAINPVGHQPLVKESTSSTNRSGTNRGKHRRHVRRSHRVSVLLCSFQLSPHDTLHSTIDHRPRHCQPFLAPRGRRMAQVPSFSMPVVRSVFYISIANGATSSDLLSAALLPNPSRKCFSSFSVSILSIYECLFFVKHHRDRESIIQNRNDISWSFGAIDSFYFPRFPGHFPRDLYFPQEFFSALGIWRSS